MGLKIRDQTLPAYRLGAQVCKGWSCLKKGQWKGRKVGIFMMGPPACGKSTAANKYFRQYPILDYDKIKEEHPDYDPKNPGALHEWSAEVIDQRFDTMVKSNRSFVLDGTGANAEHLIRKVTESKAKGYWTVTVCVYCSLETCLKRNKMRERQVPDDLIRNKHKDILFSFDAVGKYVDEQIFIQND